MNRGIIITVSVVNTVSMTAVLLWACTVTKSTCQSSVIMDNIKSAWPGPSYIAGMVMSVIKCMVRMVLTIFPDTQVCKYSMKI